MDVICSSCIIIDACMYAAVHACRRSCSDFRPVPVVGLESLLLDRRQVDYCISLKAFVVCRTAGKTFCQMLFCWLDRGVACAVGAVHALQLQLGPEHSDRDTFCRP